MEKDLQKSEYLAEVDRLLKKHREIFLREEKKSSTDEPLVNEQARSFEEAGKRELSRVDRESKERFRQTAIVTAGILGATTILGAALVIVLKK